MTALPVMLRSLGATVLIVSMLLGTRVVDAFRVPDISAVETTTTVTFPTGMRFQASIPVEHGADVDRVELLFHIGADPTLNLATVPSGSVTRNDGHVAVDLTVDLQGANFVPLGVELTYFWDVYDGDRVVASTGQETTMWADPRFDWVLSRSEHVELHSYALTDEFTAQTLAMAEETIVDLRQRYGLDDVQPIAIWVYASGADFSGTRQSNSRESVAALSYPEAAVIAAIVPDGDERELGRVLPHEISHHVLFQATRNPYTVPPLWFDEGLATRHQIGGTDHYAGMVERAEAEGRLFAITSLNASFPFQPAQATLAYASSWSMVAYLEETYGDDCIARLIEAFGGGEETGEAVRSALGIGIDQLDADWHTWVADQDAEQVAA